MIRYYIPEHVLAEIGTRKKEAEQELAKWEHPLKNARKGEKYSCVVSLPDCVLLAKLVSVGDCGLKATFSPTDPRKFLLYGIPPRAGTFTIAFNYIARGYPSQLINRLSYSKQLNILTQRLELKLVVNPDPRDLWKNVPSSPDLPYAKPDFAGEWFMEGNNELLAASQRGRSHAHTGLPRDDDFALGIFNGWYVLAVADGAGSAKFSRHGSKVACETALKICGQSLGRPNALDAIFNNARLSDFSPEMRRAAKLKLYEILPAVVSEARKELRNEAARNNCEMKDYATTLLLAVARKFPAGWAVGSFQIGDGAMAMFYGRDQVKLLAEPDEGEFGGQTRFITMKDTLESPEDLMRRVNIDFVASLDGLLLMTDGVSDAKFATLANLKKTEIWLDLWWQLGELAKGKNVQASLLEWLQFWSQGNHDDRSIAMLKVGPVLQLGMQMGGSVPALSEKR